MTDHSELVQRWRFLAAGQDDQHSVALSEACDALEAQAGTIAGMAGELGDMAHLCQTKDAEIARLGDGALRGAAELNNVKVERDRLRAERDEASAEEDRTHAALKIVSDSCDRLRAALDAPLRSPLFRQFTEQGFWHAHHVDLVWRYNGKDVREQADWLKDIWYAREALKGEKPAAFTDSSLAPGAKPLEGPVDVYDTKPKGDA